MWLTNYEVKCSVNSMVHLLGELLVYAIFRIFLLGL